MNHRIKPVNLEVTIRSPSQMGSALLRFRKLASWTQQEIGSSAGIKQAMVSQIEAGSPGTSLATLFKLLAALDLELVLRKRRQTV